MATKKIHAEIKTASGTSIVLEGERDDVANLISQFATAEAGNTGHRLLGTTPHSDPAGVVEFDSVAEKDDDGEVHLVVGDPKAKSAADAVERLTYVLLLARKALLGEKKTNRKVWVETMKGYGLYTGNARSQVAADKGLVTDRSSIALSNAVVRKARDYVKEMQDLNLTGRWVPSRGRRSRKQKK